MARVAARESSSDLTHGEPAAARSAEYHTRQRGMHAMCLSDELGPQRADPGAPDQLRSVSTAATQLDRGGDTQCAVSDVRYHYKISILARDVATN